jgi:hypothetical protein
LHTFARSGAAGRALVRRVGRARFRNDAAEAWARLSPPRWTIAPLTDAPAPAVEAAVHTYSEYQGVLKTLNRGTARWQVVPAHELQR